MYLVVGFGKLAQSVLQLNSYHQEIFIYSKTREKVETYRDPRITYLTKEEFGRVRYVLLMLPASEVNEFMQMHEKYFGDGTLFYSFATALKIQAIKTRHEVISCKLAGHAKQMVEDQHGLFVVSKNVNVVPLKTFLGESFTIIEGNEEEVLLANSLGTRAAIEMIIELEEKLKKAGIQKAVIDQTLFQVTRGNIKTFINGELGDFARKIVDEIKRGGQ
ncbi:hypothetical protein DS745_20215 [Anaerobacillus alkaliphilus]|uniref:Pyrroline-5-carboxylate reductase catalytic N-terminal domain-containing protein n=1 Tax=Anaerobacillus alkaliphilus TaxID=1548597 RepID=A0A4Q0VQ61_9BACI|nr:hypothetical protein [Anaerobacillus alkaliphilus]RXI98642.1 hypothetical protein DS745_20215 [Anaerobacillus alkaliphilus]